MSSYVLVCLVGDEPTRLAADFAEWMHERRPAVACLTNPTPEQVQELIQVNETLVVLGHDGPLAQVHSIRREARGGIWLLGAELGRRFPGSRQYLWACDVMGEGAARILALADEAKSAGARRVAGHSVTLSADFDQLGGPYAEVFRSALAQLVWGFVDGEDNPQKLRLRAREALPLNLELDAWSLESKLDWFRRSQWLHDRISNFHIA